LILINYLLVRECIDLFIVVIVNFNQSLALAFIRNAMLLYKQKEKKKTDSIKNAQNGKIENVVG
jgi:hypothetical protein